MSVGYVAVQWTGHKKAYDRYLLGGLAAYLLLFFMVGKLAWRGRHAISDEILAMRALGSAALLMLHVILCIGPLARLDPRFLPLLYNRRHLGVTTFCVALAHAVIAVGYYHGFGRINPLLSLLTSNTNYASVSAFPFQTLGLIALLILFLMAATSHDFWNRNLGPRAWKSIHMLIYPAYALLVMHVVLGALQAQRSVVLAAMLVAGVATVATLQLVAGVREYRRDRAAGEARDGWVDCGRVDGITEGRGRAVALPGGQRVAVFRHNGCISALTNTCAHQGGPLGEGRIIDGCVTCPWHGWTYRPQDGCAPPPFTEKVPTYRVRVHNGRILVEPAPLLAGTPVEPVRVEERGDG